MLERNRAAFNVRHRLRARRAAWALGLALFAGSNPARAEEGAGTLADPIVIDGFPFAHEGDTRGRESRIDSYACAAMTSESGPEALYQFTLTRPSRVLAWVAGDVAGAVDIDVHLLLDATLSGRQATCVARGNVFAEADLPAGVHWISVDTFMGTAARPGPYVLRVDALPLEETRERVVARGVRWRTRVYADLFGGAQTVNVLDVDLAEPGLSLRPVQGDGCRTVPALGTEARAVAGVNAGFFDTSAGRCSPTGLVRIDDRVLSPGISTEPPRSALGLSDMGPLIERRAWDDPWSEVHHALGGTPQLVRGATPAVLGVEESVGSSFVTGRNPRTAACVTREGRVLFVTFDGRTDAGLGVSLNDLAEYMVSLGCDVALNYDGGGSTAMWIAGQPGSGVVNYPSDAGEMVHNAGRAVSNGWFVFAPPANNAPRFVTLPVVMARAESAYRYDADAIDTDLQSITYSLASGPTGMTVDSMSGVVTWTPAFEQGGPHEVSIRASDGIEQTLQTYTLTVTGGISSDAGAGDAASTDAAGDAREDVGVSLEGGSEGGTMSMGGCGCRASGARFTPRGVAAAGLLGVLARLRRRRGARVSGTAARASRW